MISQAASHTQWCRLSTRGQYSEQSVEQVNRCERPGQIAQVDAENGRLNASIASATTSSPRWSRRQSTDWKAAELPGNHEVQPNAKTSQPSDAYWQARSRFVSRFRI